MKKNSYIIILLTVSLVSYGDEHGETCHHNKPHSCYQCWEVSFGLGKATIEEKADGHEMDGNIWHLHATKGLDKQIFGINYGLSMGVEGFFGDIKDHYHATVGLALFFSEAVHFSIGPSLGYAKHAHHDEHGHGEHEEGEHEEGEHEEGEHEEGEHEEGEHGDEHEEDEGFETEIGWHGELCFHFGHFNDYIVGGFIGYGENDHETCTEYGLSIGKHF